MIRTETPIGENRREVPRPGVPSVRHLPAGWQRGAGTRADNTAKTQQLRRFRRERPTPTPRSERGRRPAGQAHTQNNKSKHISDEAGRPKRKLRGESPPGGPGEGWLTGSQRRRGQRSRERPLDSDSDEVLPLDSPCSQAQMSLGKPRARLTWQIPNESVPWEPWKEHWTESLEIEF